MSDPLASFFGQGFSFRPDVFHDFHNFRYGQNTVQGSNINKFLELTLEEVFSGCTKVEKHYRQLANGTQEEKQVSINFPPGTKEGSQVAFSSFGHFAKVNANSGIRNVPGELRYTIKFKPHPLFESTPDGDLLYKALVPYSDLVLGGDVIVPNIAGTKTKFSLAAGTPSGKKLRIKEMGLPVRVSGLGENSVTIKKDMIVTCEAHVPEELTEEQRELVEKMRKIFSTPKEK